MSEEIATYLGPRGYTLKKEFLDIDELNLIRKEFKTTNIMP